jgi:hypothetical protein
MINADDFVLQFLKDNILTLGFLYAILKGLFPDSKILKAIGEAFTAKFGKGK